MQDSFRRALQTALQTTAHFSPNTLRTFLQSLNHDRQLQEKLTAYADRISVARLVARPGSLSRQLSNLTRDTAVPTLARLYRNIIEGLTSPEPWLTVQASQDEVKDTVVVPEFVWASFISGFVQGRRLDLAEKLWDDANNLGLMPTVAMWTALINGYAELKMVQQAINAWDAMLASGLRPDTFTYRALIYALYHSGPGHESEALRRFQAFKQDLQTMSPRPEDSSVLVVYNTMLHGLLFYHHETEACALLEEMKANGPKPDIVSFNNFLRYYGRKGQLKALADILHTIESEGLVGDVFTFSIVLSALLKVRDDAPQIMFKLMEKQGVKPNAATLTSIIDHQMKAQTEEGFRTALELLTKMEQNELAGAQPNAVTYTSILSHIHRRNWLDRKIALEYQEFLWNRMRFRGLKPNRVTYNILIKACLENPEPEGIQDAIRYYRDMVEKRIFVATDTWYILLHALVDRKEWALANELVGDMQRSGFVPPKALSNLVTKVRRQTREKMKAGPAGYI
ncbi:hypothetical protein WOLCODRAFT_135357 [Wolfiporia cocos MD-104 SS10]|uniref:Pentacotripeptide-repeat region of PRORP domain-containing protein n=1 Tax=Wolfiporia cocos (strain MD-104) TaxID=742152 RepID=A0A2H3IV43_WOLCO|nr:hypothetical protein WOLCODRAFT_135357 [Wolfiporia cocos MD-104 SS10]